MPFNLSLGLEFGSVHLQILEREAQRKESETVWKGTHVISIKIQKEEE
jgi:hypothetical protein